MHVYSIYVKYLPIVFENLLMMASADQNIYEVVFVYAIAFIS
jgi:hypothetical protein